MTEAFTPSPFAVFYTVNHQGRPTTLRLGAARTLEDARELITKANADMQNTFGGLLSTGPVKPRVYHIFRAEWTNVTVAEAA